jgi:hypothetical protein
MPDRYAVIVQEALWHGSPRRTGAPGANMAGNDGRPLWPQPATGLMSEGWCVLLDYQGGRPDAQVTALAAELRGSVDYVTGFTSNSPNETPEHGTRHDLTDVTVAHLRNMLAWQRAGIPSIPSLSPAYDDTPVMGERALQVLYESRADLVACIKYAAEEAPDIGGYRTFGYHSGNCHREGTSIYDSMPPLGPVEYAADGLPTRLHPWGTMHLDALKEAMA